ncbi:MAG: hypothetical protein JSV96_05675 [Candidatus Aminicenantes bacterium]|nr:MAG: hypothetical protein JSV96_05675 [Candidatus Aminicenantes bacterium]
MGNLSKNKGITLGDLLPHEIHGWKAGEKDEVYDQQTIFDYINGAGEVYRAYNFELLLARRFAKEGQPNIIADLFKMASAKDAFGVFTHDLEGEDAGIGQGSTYKGGLLSFWKGQIFVSLYSEEETEEAKNMLFALGKIVASAIKEEGEMPDIVSLLPQENLVEKSAHYFHNHLILNYHFYVSDENILLLDQESEAALGVYKENDERAYLLVVSYPEKDKVSKAYVSFTKAYMPDAAEPGLVKTEDQKWTAARIKNDFLIVIFNAQTDSSAKEMIKSVEKNID